MSTDENDEPTVSKNNHELEETVLALKREKRAKKTIVTKIRHNLEKMCAQKSKLNRVEIETEIEALWDALETGLSVMDELCSTYIKSNQAEAKEAILKEQENFESDGHQAVENAQQVIKEYLSSISEQGQVSEVVNVSPALTTVEASPPISESNSTGTITVNGSPASVVENEGPPSPAVNSTVNVTTANAVSPGPTTTQESPQSSANHVTGITHRLKPLTIPVFYGDKTRFEDFWALFVSLVDEGSEPVNIKMARLRQSLSGNALDAIRGLGVTAPEYNEAKEILKAKFGGQRRQLQAYLDQLENMPTLKNNDIQSFERFADLVRVTVVKLEAEGRSGELGDGALHSLLVKKLSERQVENYSRWLSEQHKIRSVRALKDWLKEEVIIRVEATEMAQGVESKQARDNDRGKSKPTERGHRLRTWFTSRDGNQSTNDNIRNSNSKPPCAVCGSNHGVWSCKVFSGMSVADRWRVAKEKHLCFRCLASNHVGKDCTRSRPCAVQGCKRSHHSLLHEAVLKKREEDEKPELTREGADTRTHTSRKESASTAEVLSLRTIPVWLKANGRKVKINAILDDASNETFLNEQVAGVLGLQEPYKTVRVHVLNNEVETFQSMPVQVMIESVNGQYRKEISVKTCPQNVTGSYKVEDWSKNKINWPHLQGCDFATPAKGGLVDILIGVDNADLLYSRADVRGKPGSPIARLGPLGWSCIGVTEKQQGTDCRTHTIRTFLSRNTADSTSCCEIDEQIKRFWEIESYGTENMNSKVHTEGEREALKKVKESVSHCGATSRYKIAIPWKENRPKLPDNRNNALIRLGSTEQKLKKDETLSKEYQHTIESYVEKGYLRKVGKDEVIPPVVWYLPHFPIIRMDKTTTKVRIVFDCSAKTDGLSLNDVINPGPKLQRELFDVLLRFRRHQVALACDIKEMYLQVEIEEDDRPYFRVLWRDLDGTKEPDVYEFTRVVFGKNSAPMEAQFIAQENARLHQDTYPLATETVLKSTYMDDSIDSVETDEIGVELYRQLSSLWNHAGMQARKWVSNSEAVMEAIPVEDQAAQLTITDNKYPVVKTLGVTWDSKEDILTLPTSRISSDIPLTKRNVLRKIASVFDPLGFISPFVMVAKVILQELWVRGYDWDDTIEDEIANRIAAWFEQLHVVASIHVPRCLCENKVVARRELVTFVDASLKSYGTVVYLRCTYEDGTYSCRLIASKCKVAPLLPMTVPRLELMAAVLGLRLTQNVLRALEMNMQDVSFYSDSADVLWWIRGCGRDFRPFIANRIGEIQMYSNPAQWQHVRTDENPADLCTRGATPLQLSESTLWWNGPVWLMQDTSKWPRMDLTKAPVDVTEKKAALKKDSKGNAVVSDGGHSLATKAEEAIDPTEVWRLDPHRFSDWKHLVRIQARVSRVLTNMRSKQKRQQCQTELAPEEIRDAEDAIIRKAQEESFAAEYAALSKRKPLSTKSQLAKLSPRMDQQGVIRCNSRLYYAESLPYDARCPIILPRGHWVTKLIVRYYHALANHIAGTNFVLAQISQRFWIVAAREEIREWENECCTCQKRKNKLASQVMGPLPKVRLRFTYRAFDQTAVDYAGPFTTIQGRGKQRLKRWLCLFTCLTTRAVHLEVAWGLDTDSFLNAFTRFTSRRGIPKEVISDNGTNFVGAVNELKDLVRLLDREKIQRATTHNGTTWAFNPPGGPHFGGVFEIMVKAAKKAIYAVIKNSDVTDEELITICAGVEGFMNSRPITYQSMNPSDDVPLTPNHFLHGQLGGEFAPEVIDMDANPRERWRKVQAILSRVWDRWLKEYLPTLNTRTKWTNVVKDLKDGDVVMVLDKDLPRGKWPLGRIVATYPGKDGHSRVAKVQLGSKSLIRPIHKLVPLRV